jgi:hypothetical protein
MKMQLMLAVNDCNGVHTGQVDQVEVDDLIYLEGEPISCSHTLFELEVDSLLFKFSNYGTWVGNMCWDCVTLDGAHVAKIVNHLRSIGWSCTEAETSLFEAYHDGETITAKMLEELCSPSL